MSFHANDYRGEHYPDYLKTSHWKKLKDQLIYSNPKAECWICHKTYSLLLHHLGEEAYANLFAEKLDIDVVILCLTCHERVHFHKHNGRKIPLTRKDLLFRMRILRITYTIRTFRLGSFLNRIAHAVS